MKIRRKKCEGAYIVTVIIDSSSHLRKSLPSTLGGMVMCFALLAFVLPVDAQQTYKIMAIGDSITVATSKDSCYRWHLGNRLRDAGYDIDFVGAQSGTNGNGDTSWDSQHEGYWGEVSQNVASQVGQHAPQYQPDIALIHLGTNNLRFSPDNDPPRFTDEMHYQGLTDCITHLRNANPDVIVFVCKLIRFILEPDNPAQTRIPYFNDVQLPEWVVGWNTTESPVIIVDQWTDFNTATDLGDGLHPNTSGAIKMSDKFFEMIDQHLRTVPPPSGLTASLSNYQVTLDWIDNSNGAEQETGFIIQRRAAGGIHNNDWVDIDQVDPDITTYFDSGPLHGDVTYYYRVGSYK